MFFEPVPFPVLPAALAIDAGYLGAAFNGLASHWVCLEINSSERKGALFNARNSRPHSEHI